MELLLLHRFCRKYFEEKSIENVEFIFPEYKSENETVDDMYLMSKCKSGDIITMYINTPGGSVYDGLGLYDLMQYAKKKNIIIRTVNIGKACSMGSILLMAGSKGYRESLPNCAIMIHEISTMDYGKTSELKDQMKELDRLQKIVNNIISECSDPKLIELSERKDLWLDANEALEYKIIDKIIK